MITQQILDNYADAGFPLFPVNGKIPSKKEWQKTPHDPFPELKEFPHNLGLVLLENILIIDVDPRNFGTSNPLEKLKKDLNIDILALNTFIVKTGSGEGYHIYLKKPPGTEIRKNIKEYPGLDFLSKGNYVVGIGSTNKDTKIEYKTYNGSPTKLLNAPTSILTLIQKAKQQKAPKEEKGKKGYNDSKQTQSRYTEYLLRADPAIEGAGGDLVTYKVAAEGRDLNLSPAVTHALIMKFYNESCSPPWDPEQLQIKINNAYKYANGAAGSKDPTQQFDATPAPPETSLPFDMNDGKVKKTLHNLVLYFRGAESKLTGTLAFNEFTQDITIINPPPWEVQIGSSWEDADAIQCKYYLSSEKKYEANINTVHEAALVVAKERSYHPVKDYLNSLTWDNKPFLGDKNTPGWLTTFAGVPDSPYVRDVSAKVLAAAVARIFNPGVKFDTMLILEGPQGKYKSTMWEVMAGDWYAELHNFDPQNKDIINDMQGSWFIDSGELRCVKKADVDALKGFLSRRTDKARLAYARTSKEFPRQSIFVGTTNPGVDNEYLRDTTGNRRFWPVTIGTILIDALRERKDQLWAEAVVRYKGGEDLWLSDETSANLAALEQHKRLVSDPWAEPIREWLDATGLHQATPAQIYTDALGGALNMFNKVLSSRITHVMINDLKWQRRVYREGDKTIRGFIKYEFLEE